MALSGTRRIARNFRPTEIERSVGAGVVLLPVVEVRHCNGRTNRKPGVYRLPTPKGSDAKAVLLPRISSLRRRYIRPCSTSSTAITNAANT